jgi:uncharacterized glyoxalase superfamily protein PhnB
VKPTPPGWPRLSGSVFYDDPKAAIDWLCKAFDFKVRLLVEGEGGRVDHSELEYGEALIMVGQSGEDLVHRKDPDGPPMVRASPRSTDGRVTQVMCIVVDDVDAHCAQARAAGAVIGQSPSTQDYGEDYWVDRSYRAIDPEGHHWWFMQRLATKGRLQTSA